LNSFPLQLPTWVWERSPSGNNRGRGSLSAFKVQRFRPRPFQSFQPFHSFHRFATFQSFQTLKARAFNSSTTDGNFHVSRIPETSKCQIIQVGWKREPPCAAPLIVPESRLCAAYAARGVTMIRDSSRSDAPSLISDRISKSNQARWIVRVPFGNWESYPGSLFRILGLTASTW
jgi:hypothetical protein